MCVFCVHICLFTSGIFFWYTFPIFYTVDSHVYRVMVVIFGAQFLHASFMFWCYFAHVCAYVCSMSDTLLSEIEKICSEWKDHFLLPGDENLISHQVKLNSLFRFHSLLEKLKSEFASRSEILRKDKQKLDRDIADMVEAGLKQQKQVQNLLTRQAELDTQSLALIERLKDKSVSSQITVFQNKIDHLVPKIFQTATIPKNRDAEIIAKRLFQNEAKLEFIRNQV